MISAILSEYVEVVMKCNLCVGLCVKAIASSGLSLTCVVEWLSLHPSDTKPFPVSMLAWCLCVCMCVLVCVCVCVLRKKGGLSED
jgi:hypothetical protein